MGVKAALLNLSFGEPCVIQLTSTPWTCSMLEGFRERSRAVCRGREWRTAGLLLRLWKGRREEEMAERKAG